MILWNVVKLNITRYNNNVLYNSLGLFHCLRNGTSEASKWQNGNFFFKCIIRHWQWKNSGRHFYWPHLISTDFFFLFSIHNVHGWFDIKNVPECRCNLQKNHAWSSERTILAAKNKVVDDWNVNTHSQIDDQNAFV